jgi:acyl-CoA synthetase (NDP forming)
VADAREAEEAAIAIGFPVAIKVDSASVAHKSDQGGVSLDLKSGAAVRSAVGGMARQIHAADMKYLVQRYIPGGKQVVVAKAEEASRLVMRGLGGIFTETLGDVTFKLAPITHTEVTEML